MFNGTLHTKVAWELETKQGLEASSPASLPSLHFFKFLLGLQLGRTICYIMPSVIPHFSSLLQAA